MMISTFTGESISCLPKLLHTVFAVARVLLAVSDRARMLCQMRMHAQVLVFDFERQRLTNRISSAPCHCAHGHPPEDTTNSITQNGNNPHLPHAHLQFASPPDNDVTVHKVAHVYLDPHGLRTQPPQAQKSGTAAVSGHRPCNANLSDHKEILNSQLSKQRVILSGEGSLSQAYPQL